MADQDVMLGKILDAAHSNGEDLKDLIERSHKIEMSQVELKGSVTNLDTRVTSLEKRAEIAANRAIGFVLAVVTAVAVAIAVYVVTKGVGIHP